MGLLGKLLGNSVPQKKATDDVLLLHGMLLMCGADGNVEAKELFTLQNFYNTLPEFEGKDFKTLLNEANKVVAKYGNLKESVKALGEIQSDAVKKKLFILSADIAMSSGDVDEQEDKLLEQMQRILGVDDTLAQKALEILALKYAK